MKSKDGGRMLPEKDFAVDINEQAIFHAVSIEHYKWGHQLVSRRAEAYNHTLQRRKSMEPKKLAAVMNQTNSNCSLGVGELNGSYSLLF